MVGGDLGKSRLKPELQRPVSDRAKYNQMDTAMTRCNARLLVLGLVLGLVQAVGCDKRPGPADTPAAADSADAKSSGEPVAGDLRTAQAVLEKMTAAYKNASSYADFGTLEFRQDPARASSDTRVSFSVAFVRPDKLRAELFNGQVVCDGKQWYAACDARARTGRASRGPGKAQPGRRPCRLLVVFRPQRRRAIHVAPTPPALARRSDQEPAGGVAGGDSRRTRPLGQLRLLPRPFCFARRPRLLVDRSEDFRLANAGRADCHRAAVRGRRHGPILSG